MAWDCSKPSLNQPGHTCCVLCNSYFTETLDLIDIPSCAQPFEPSNCPQDFLITLTLVKCSSCGHMSLDTPPVPYYKRVIRSVDISPEMTNHRLRQFHNIQSRLDVTGNSVNVLEVGAGNGQYSLLLANVFGRCDATEFNQSGSAGNVTFIPTHPDEDDFLEKLAHKMPYDLIACFSYLEHLPNPKSTLKLIYELLSDDGLALIEVPNSSYIQRRSLLNEVIPDHLHYFSTQSLTTAIYSAGFELESIQPTWHDYILTAILRKPHNNSLSTLEANYECLKKSIQSALSLFPDSATIVVWGAGHQALYTIATTALKDRLSLIVDSSPAKQGTIIPQLRTPIVAPSDIEGMHIDVLFVICAGYNQEVLRQLRSLSFANSPYCYSITSNQLIPC